MLYFRVFPSGGRLLNIYLRSPLDPRRRLVWRYKTRGAAGGAWLNCTQQKLILHTELGV